MDTLTAAPPSRLNLTAAIIESIRSASFDGLKALPRRGAEIGGLVVAPARSNSVDIELRLVPCEYFFGPSYHLSPHDLAELRKAAAECAAAGKNVVAYFRSSTRQALTVAPEDSEAMQEALPDVPFVVLSKPSMSGRADIVVFHRDSESGKAWISTQEIEAAPLIREKSAGAVAEQASLPDVSQEVPPAAERPARQPEPDAFPNAPADRHVSVSPHRPGSRIENRRDPYLWYAGALALAALCLIAIGVSSKGSPAPLPAEPVATVAPDTQQSYGSLGLEVLDENGKFHIMWNRASTAAISATAGELEITEAGKSRSIPLRPLDITSGSILYTPHSGDVAFRLQVRNASGDPTEEMIRVLAPASQPVVSQAAVTTQITSSGAAPPAPVAPEQVMRASASPPSQMPGTPAPPRTDKMLSMTVRTGAAVRGPATPPVPLHQELPATKGLPFPMNTPARIGVMVSVDSSGQVVGANVDPRSRGYSAYLLGLSLKAARGWQFQPATRGGQPVQGEYKIEFVFPATVRP